jgi:ketosteroid isomerase-like protein
MTHTGDLALSEQGVVEPTGLQITVNGVTVAEFQGEQICSVRQYWDELTVFEQLGLLHEEP